MWSHNLYTIVGTWHKLFSRGNWVPLWWASDELKELMMILDSLHIQFLIWDMACNLYVRFYFPLKCIRPCHSNLSRIKLGAIQISDGSPGEVPNSNKGIFLWIPLLAESTVCLFHWHLPAWNSPVTAAIFVGRWEMVHIFTEKVKCPFPTTLHSENRKISDFLSKHSCCKNYAPKIR